MEELHRTEIDAIFAHELAHIKYGSILIVEISLVSLATWVFAMFFAQFAINLMMFIIAELAVMMVMLSFVLRRNETLADTMGGKATTPEALVSVLEYFRAKCKVDDGSMTHPSFRARIKRLLRLFDSVRGKRDD